MLTLEPEASNPFGQIVTALKGKIESTDLSFYKYLDAQGTPLKKVYDQQGVGGDSNAWDPPLSKCPAVILLASAFPPGEDHGIGDERWFFAVSVMFKMRLPSSDASPAFQACYELIRTIMAGWRQPQLDPIGPSAIPGLCDYEIDGNVTPHISDADSGRKVAKMAFDIRFRFNKTILGGGL